MIAVVHWCLRVETHACGYVVSAAITFCLHFGRHDSINWSIDNRNDWSNSVSSRDMCVNWNEPQISCIQLYEQPSALNDAWVWAGGCKRILPRYPKGQSRTCYQECGCHLYNKETYFFWGVTIWIMQLNCITSYAFSFYMFLTIGELTESELTTL